MGRAKKNIKSFGRRLVVLVAVLVLSCNLVSSTVSAAPKTACPKGLSELDCDAILGGWVNWIPESGSTSGACGGVYTGVISGSSNAEMIWNFLTGDKGMTAVAVAGIMGNFSQESGLDPAVKENFTTRAIPDGGDDHTGFGLAQWTSQGRQAGLFTKLRDAGLGKYYGAGWGHPEIDKDIPKEDVQNLITIELNYAWDGDSTKISDIADQLNAARSVSGDAGSTVLFHKLFERSADNASQIQDRVDDAEVFLKQYGGTAGTSSCAGELGGVATLEDGIAWAMKFVEDTRTAYNPGGHSLNEEKVGDSRINLYVTGDGPVSGPMAGCWGALWCGQCTALTGWFVTNMTSIAYGYRHGNGGEVVGILGDNGVPTGSEPRPFSIFSYNTSSVGHTGVVLGTLGNGEVITMENNLSENTLAILKYNIKESHPDVRFAYVEDKLKVAGLGSTE